jgi:hypothetical protein
VPFPKPNLRILRESFQISKSGNIPNSLLRRRSLIDTFLLLCPCRDSKRKKTRVVCRLMLDRESSINGGSSKAGNE